MDDKKGHIIYSKAQIENYLQGKMSKEEMHSLERASLQDPFLADAIEGFRYADVNTTEKDLTAIEAEILADKQNAKVFTMATKKNGWLRMAVAAVLFIGAGFIAILLMNKTNKKSIDTIVSNEKVMAPVESHDTNIIDKDHRVIPSEVTVSASKENAVHQPSKESEILHESVALKDDYVLPDTSTPLQQQSVAVGTISFNQNNASNKTAGASATNNFSNYIAANNDKKDNNLRQIADRNKEIFVTNSSNNNATGGTYTNASYENAKDNVVVLPTITMKNDSSFNKIPVTAYASKKTLAKPIAYKFTKEDSLMVPVNGWTAFNEYLQHHSKRTISYDTAYSPVTITDMKTGAEIVGLEFDVDKFGTPDKIKVTKSVDPETDAKAIELLKNGPKWTNRNKNQKGKVSIKF